jgi:hypothetical protein
MVECQPICEKNGVALGVFATPTYLLTRSGVEGGDDLIEQRDVELWLGEIEDCLCVLGEIRLSIGRHWRGGREADLHWGNAQS